MQEMRFPTASTLLGDAIACTGFYTRLPLPHAETNGRSFADQQWAAPVAGLVVGVIVWAVIMLASTLGIPATVAAALGLAAGIATTGALHEDGLADVADGFGGGKTRDDKLAIMRDSRIGSYGTLALALSVLIRWSALAALASALPTLTLLPAIVAVHAASRALIPDFMRRVPPARADGLAAGVGEIGETAARVALIIGAATLLACGAVFLIVASAALCIVHLLVAQLARRQIGGHTGDVLGALQQAAEVAILCVATAILI